MRVQVPPHPVPRVIVDPAHQAALRARQTALFHVLQMNVNLKSVDIHLHKGNEPTRIKTQKLRI
jgi:hypothetical protein